MPGVRRGGGQGDAPKLQDGAPDADKPPTDDRKSGPQINTPAGNVPLSWDNKSMTVNGGPDGQESPLLLELMKIRMSALADVLTPMVDKPVVDITGLDIMTCSRWG